MEKTGTISLWIWLDQSPVIRGLLAVVMAVLGYWHLSHGNTVIGGFAWWCCGVNCAKLARTNWRSDEHRERNCNPRHDCRTDQTT